MSKEQELWLELYNFIDDVNKHITMELTNTHWKSVSIKLTKSYVVSNWATCEDEWETSYITSECNTFIECLEQVVNKLKQEDWVY